MEIAGNARTLISGLRGAVAAPARGFHGLGLAGFAIVAAIALVLSLNTTVRFLVTMPMTVWLDEFRGDLFFHATLGTLILLACVWARNRVPERGARQYAAVALAVVVATAIGLLVTQISDRWFNNNPDHLLYTLTELVRYSFLGLVIASAWLYLLTEAEQVAAAARCVVDSQRMDREIAEARVQMLEAQIEPHFLFNTLAHVRRLYETDAVAGARMMRNLQDYLAVALPQLRGSDSTLGREIDHATAYLGIQQIRMGRRLAFAIDVPDGLRAARMPSLMLLTLVENAIKHGLSPLPEGGRIDVRAAVQGIHLRVEVADTGGGFTHSTGGGTGLANTRARLTSYYGTEATFALALNEPKGVVATLMLPYQAGEPMDLGPTAASPAATA